MHPTGEEAKPRKPQEMSRKCSVGPSMSKFYVGGKKKKNLPVCTVCDAGIVYLYHTEPLTEQMREEDVESGENVKKKKKHDPGCSRWE